MRGSRVRVVVALLCLSPCAVRGDVILPPPPPPVAVVEAAPEPAPVVEEVVAAPPPQAPAHPEELGYLRPPRVLVQRGDERAVLVALGYVDQPDEPEVPVTLPPNPFAAMCESGCATSPGDHPVTLVPDPCPGGLCARNLTIRVDGRRGRLELGGALYDKDVSLVAPSEPLTFQVYTSGAVVVRCTIPAGIAGKVGLDRSEDAWRLSPGGSPCATVGQGGQFSVGEVLPFPPSVLDGLLADARAALRPELYRDDEAVTRWLIANAKLPPRVDLQRRSAESAGADSVVMRTVTFPDLVEVRGRTVCTECAADLAFVRDLVVVGTMTMTGGRAAEYCRAWDAAAGGSLALVVNDRLQATWRARGPCPAAHPFSFATARVPFDTPPLPPWIPRPDPELPAVVTVPWRLPARPQPGAAAPPAAVLGSIADLGAWLAATESDPFLRVKAVHDWVARNIAYDGPAYVAHRYPPQDAETVFRTRIGVCAGYSNLMAALGTAAGLDIRYVQGFSLASGAPVGHAWNVARVGDRWYPLDATWDAGSLAGAKFTASYPAEWLFTPPEIFLATHLPTDPAWQLVARPWTPAEALARPMLGDVVLVFPRTLPAVAEGDLYLRASGASGAGFRRPAGRTVTPCAVEPGTIAAFTCALPAAGDWIVELTGADGQYAGQLAATQR